MGFISFGVYKWQIENRYYKQTPLKLFKREFAADRYADKLNQTAPYDGELERGYVVRAYVPTYQEVA